MVSIPVTPLISFNWITVFRNDRNLSLLGCWLRARARAPTQRKYRFPPGRAKVKKLEKHNIVGADLLDNSWAIVLHLFSAHPFDSICSVDAATQTHKDVCVRLLTLISFIEKVKQPERSSLGDH